MAEKKQGVEIQGEYLVNVIPIYIPYNVLYLPNVMPKRLKCTIPPSSNLNLAAYLKNVI